MAEPAGPDPDLALLVAAVRANLDGPPAPQLSPAVPPAVPGAVLAIVCARCGAAGIPMSADWCPRCGLGGNGWAQLDRQVLLAAEAAVVNHLHRRTT